MHVALVRHVFDRARLECALAPRVARALGMPAKVAAPLALGVPSDDDAFATWIAPALAAYRDRYGVAVGKGAAAMAWGAGAVTAGVCITPVPAARLPAGWRNHVSAHPDPDERSLEAAGLVRRLVDRATDEDIVVALVSGGASAMLEEPRVPLGELRGLIAALMAAGAPIDELNTVRSALSSIKGGGLALDCGARIVTLVASDVIGDALATVGSGPTIGPWLDAPHTPVDHGAVAEARRAAAIAILARAGLAVPAVLAVPIAAHVVTRDDRADLVSRMRDFADAAARGLRHEGIAVRVVDEPMRGDPDAIALRLAAEPGPVLLWGEPTVRVPPNAGEGGRMQQLALALARRLAGSRRTAIAFGTDGMDGPPPAARPWPAGAFVDGATWGAIIGAGVDPDRAQRRCDAGPALAAAGALFVTGPTGINHADVVVVA